MSSAANLKLPRFDEAMPAAHCSASQRPLIEATDMGSSSLSALDEHDVAEASASGEKSGDTLSDDVNREMVDQAIDALNVATQDLELRFKQRVTETLQTLVGDLLPLLSDSFLAEEIGRHLPSLLPSQKANIQIRAASALANRLRLSIERCPDLYAVCEIIESDELAMTSVQLTWPMGGGDFDFEELLAASLARLNLIHV